MTGGPDAISKAINKSTPGQPRQIRSQVGLTDDPVPEGKHIAQPECVQLAALCCMHHRSVLTIYMVLTVCVNVAFLLHMPQTAAQAGFGLQTSSQN